MGKRSVAPDAKKIVTRATRCIESKKYSAAVMLMLHAMSILLAHLCLDVVHLDRICHNGLTRSLLLLPNLEPTPSSIVSLMGTVHCIINIGAGQ